MIRDPLAEERLIIDRSEGRVLFGVDADAYDAARPPYPERVYDLLAEHCGLGAGCRVLDVGAGSGLATRRLAALGAAEVTALEPDARFAPALEAIRTSAGARVRLVLATLEAADLEDASFDLVTAATSFHWIPQTEGLAIVARVLRSGGWLALWWHVFGDPERPDPFHEATSRRLASLARSPTHGEPGIRPFSLDTRARLADLEASGAFGEISVNRIDWTLCLDPPGVRALYATFSPIARLPEADRERLLDELQAVAEGEFRGEVERAMVTPIYLARRC